jgi:hypothetical protein
MPKYMTPIFDRTASDIENLTAKAFFNIVDWERVNHNTQTINELVSAITTTDVEFTLLDIPTITTFPTAAEINALITNIENVRIACGLPIDGLVELKNDWKAGMSGQSPNFEDVNDWESVLEIIFRNMKNSAEYIIYCGVSSVGQIRHWQNRYRRYAWVEASDTPVRRPRTNVGNCGTGLMRQNGWRKYD